MHCKRKTKLKKFNRHTTLTMELTKCCVFWCEINKDNIDSFFMALNNYYISIYLCVIMGIIAFLNYCL